MFLVVVYGQDSFMSGCHAQSIPFVKSATVHNTLKECVGVEYIVDSGEMITIFNWDGIRTKPLNGNQIAELNALYEKPKQEEPEMDKLAHDWL